MIRMTTYIAALLLLATPTAYAQLRGDLVEMGHNNSGIQIELFVSNSGFGELTDTWGSGATISGEATVLVFPKELPFTDIFIPSWNAAAQPLSAPFEFVQGLVDIDVTLMEYEARLVEPGLATVGDFPFPDNFQIDPVTYHVNAMVRVESKQLGLDVTIQHDAITQEPLTGRISFAVGDLFLGYTPPPRVSLQADPNDLPAGISTVEVQISMDAGNTSYHGDAIPAPPGDSDVDDDIDLADFAFNIICTADMTDPRCGLHDFDDDNDTDLFDFAEFQSAFTGELTGP